MTEISTISLLKGALTFTTALAWNQSAKNIIDSIFPVKDEKNTMAQLIYALLITLIIIIVIQIFNYMNDKLNCVKNKLTHRRTAPSASPCQDCQQYMLNVPLRDSSR